MPTAGAHRAGSDCGQPRLGAGPQAGVIPEGASVVKQRSSSGRSSSTSRAEDPSRTRPANLLRTDGQNHTYLVAAPVPLVRAPCVTVGEELDVLRAAFTCALHDTPADCVVAGRIGSITDGQGDAESRYTFFTFWWVWTVLITT